MTQRVTETRLLKVLLLVSLIFSFPSDALSIVIRHDRDDHRYLELGQDHPELVSIGRAHGTLIAPEWVLTAAHVVEGLSPISGTVRVGREDMPIQRVVLHPSWKGNLGPGLAEPDWVDLALLKLVRPVKGISPAVPYSRSDEKGLKLLIVGAGRTGTGRTGPSGEDQKMRGATNVVHSVDSDRLYFEFESPPEGTDLEGISGPGDSGGPALVDQNGMLYVLGVSSWNQHEDRGLEECTYGTREVYTRVSRHLKWIKQTMNEERNLGTVTVFGEAGWPSTPAAKLAERFFKIFNRGDRDDLLEFAHSVLVEEPGQLLSPEQWSDLWYEQRQEYGKVTPTHFVDLSDHKIEVLTASADHWRCFRFELRGIRPPRLRELSVKREQSISGAQLPAAKDMHAEEASPIVDKE